MDAFALYTSGNLNAAIEALGVDLRKQPSDTKRRTFLFELLCFAGQYDRALKQLDVLASASTDAESGALVYRAALHAQRTRDEMFLKNELPEAPPEDAPGGTLNGTPFAVLTDDDERIGAALEVFIAGSYTWIPFHYLESVEMRPPTRLRDLLWAPAIVKTTRAFRLQDLGEVLLPVLAPLSWQHADDAVRLGRASVWYEDARGQAVPAGQKLLLAGDMEIPLLEIRTLSFQATATASIDTGEV